MAIDESRKCIDCIWNWQDVHGGEDRICYNRLSAHFHAVAPLERCSKFETRPVIRDIWRIPKKENKRSGRK